MVSRELDLIRNSLMNERFEAMRRDIWCVVLHLTPLLLKQATKLCHERLSGRLNAFPCAEGWSVTDALAAQQIAQITKLATIRLVMLQIAKSFVQERECFLELALFNMLQELLLEDSIPEGIDIAHKRLCQQLVHSVPFARKDSFLETQGILCCIVTLSNLSCPFFTELVARRFHAFFLKVLVNKTKHVVANLRVSPL